MIKIDFNNNFKGFIDKEDILIDTGVLFALLNEHDAWYKTVNELFDNFIFNNSDDVLFLYINPCIQNEITNLLDSNKLYNYYNTKYPQLGVTKQEVENIEKKSIIAIEKLIEEDILLILDSNKESSLKQLKLYKELGAADAINVSIVDEYGISFLTVDNKLVNNIVKRAKELENIQNIYYTNPSYRTY